MATIKGYNIDTSPRLYAVDFGMKSGKTTGSIAASSNQLTVSSLNGLALGDTIIVEIGGEATFNGRVGGALGTKGVGGTFPALSYANLTAMQADTGKPNGLRAWREDNGTVYTTSSGTWSPVSVPIMVGDYPLDEFWYDKWAKPKALRAKITNITGLVLTLNRSATVGTTNANVYFDNSYIISRLCMNFNYPHNLDSYDLFTYIDTSSLSETYKTIVLPEGLDYAIGEQFYFERDGMTLTGAGMDSTRLFSPNGCSSANIVATQCHNSIIKNFTLEGNARLSGFGSYWEIWEQDHFNRIVTEYEPIGYPEGMTYSNTDGASAYNIKFIDVFWTTAGSREFCSNLYRNNIQVERTAPFMMYIQWHLQDAESSDCTWENCSFDSDYITKAFECFNGVNSKYINCTSRNGLWSLNNATDFLLDGCTQTITTLSKPASIDALEGLVNVAMNSGAGATGGIIRDHTMVLEGYIDDNNDCMKGIIVGGFNSGVTIEDSSYTAPNAFVGAEIGPSGIISTSTDLTVDNFTVVGTPIGDDFYRSNVSMTDGSITNSIAPYFHLEADVVRSNLTGTIVTV